MFSPRRLLPLVALAATLVPAAGASAAPAPLPPTQMPTRTYFEGQNEALPVPLRCMTLATRCEWRFFVEDVTATAGVDFPWNDAGVRVTMTGGEHGGTYLPMGILIDGVHEGTETFTLRALQTVTTTSGFRYSRIDNATITIKDIDPAPPAGISVSRPPTCVACATVDRQLPRVPVGVPRPGPVEIDLNR